MKQFRLAYIRPSADGKTYTAVIVDHDCDRFTEFPQDVKVLRETYHGPLVKFPAHMLVHRTILDLDR